MDKTIVINQWTKAREVIFNLWQNKISEVEKNRDRILLVTKFLEENDPDCKIDFINDEEGNKFNVQLGFNEGLTDYISSIMETGELPKEVVIKPQKKKKKK